QRRTTRLGVQRCTSFFSYASTRQKYFESFFTLICKKLKMRKMYPKIFLSFFHGVGFGYGIGAEMDGNAVVGSFIVEGKLGLITRLAD
ncbi:hypothetical protein, partial [Dyadobacter sp. 3J3]|uniref:hypothetical protein n=1 Tax=Dyadobacter sp. 3J3 TaxID=2606600 RepID=UPI001E5B6BBC